MLTVSCRDVRPLYQARNDSPLAPKLLLAKLVNIPFPPIHRPRQHSRDLVDDKHQSRHAPKATSKVKPSPLYPLNEVVRIQHILEEPSLRDLVVLLNRARLDALLLRQALLPLLLPAADVAQLVVVVEVGRQAEVEDRDAHGELQGRVGRELHGPGFSSGGPVGSEPAADEGAVDDLEEGCRGPHEEVDG